MSAIQSVAQALLDSSDGLTSGELIAETEETKQGVYNAISALRGMGYVVRDAERRQTVVDSAALAAIAKGERPPKTNGKTHAAPPRVDDEKPKPQAKKTNKAPTPRESPKVAATDGVQCMIFGDFCVVHKRDLIELLRALKRWSEIAVSAA